MNMIEIKHAVNSKDYNFLRENPHLGENIILLGLGGSHAYGTNTEGSDLDVRGIALNSPKEILLGRDFEQIVNETTDTTIYSLKKMITLLSNCNPNTIELLGLKPKHYLYVSPEGYKLLENKKLFLSKKAVNSFGGYANQQLYRLNQKAAHAMSQKELESHILKTLEFMQAAFDEKYKSIPDDAIHLYIDKAVQEGYDTEIFLDGQLSHVSLRDFSAMLGEFNNTIRQYNKLGKRNDHAYEHGKIAKHMMHLIRLYFMCFDILEKEEINTYRIKEHDLLMDIWNGAYLDVDNQPIPEFFEMVNEFEKRLAYDKENTALPENPNYSKIEELVLNINEDIITKNKEKDNIYETEL